MSKYKIIAFDLDDTLVDDNEARKYAISKVAESLGIDYTEKIGNDYILFDNQFWHKWENGEIIIPSDVEDWVTYIRSKRFQLFFPQKELDMNAAIQSYHLYSKSLEDCIVPIEGAKETLEILKKNYKLVIATNGIKRLATHKLNKLQAESYISDIVCSEEIGKNKPDALFFEELVKQCQCTKEEILLVGDSLKSDILGGMNYGMDTCWFNRNYLPLPQEYTPTMEINNLLELTRKL